MQNTVVLRFSLIVIRYVLFVMSVEISYSQSFDQFISSLNNLSDSSARSQIITEYLTKQSTPIVEDSIIHFVYRGAGTVGAVPGEMNGWNPSHGIMTRLAGTDFFYRAETIPIDGRVEYKLWIDSSWMLDPLNPNTAMGGYGENSDARMPGYKSVTDDEYFPSVGRGAIDSTWIESKYLQRTHPVFIYMPRQMKTDTPLPVVYVTDGGDYLSFGRMNIILDNLIAAKRIRPIVAIFIDPRTDINDASTNKRMSDYAANDAYLDFLEKEVAPYIEQHYPVSRNPHDRLIMGASMGGLISTYTVLKRPEFVGNCIIQSPAYRQAGSAVIKLAEKIEKPPGSIYIQTGTINDTKIEANYVYELLKEKGANIRYEEIHEGHNWTNWRTHISKILEYFLRAK